MSSIDFDERINVLLDLDQTLIAAVPIVKDEDDDEEEEDQYYDFGKHKKKARLFDFENMDDYYIIFQRPNLQEFLDYLFANFNVSVWTAASKDYALFIVDKILLIKPERQLDYIFFNYHCTISSKVTGYTKSLKMLWEVYKDDKYNKNNTLIIDDYDEVCETQPYNCIPIEPFHFTKKNSQNDEFLINLIKKLENLKKDNIIGNKEFANVFKL